MATTSSDGAVVTTFSSWRDGGVTLPPLSARSGAAGARPLLYAAVFLHPACEERCGRSSSGRLDGSAHKIQRLAQHTRYIGDQEFLNFIEASVLSEPVLLRHLGERHTDYHYKLDVNETNAQEFEIQYIFDEQSNVCVLCVSKYGCGAWRSSAFIVEALNEFREAYPTIGDSIGSFGPPTEDFHTYLGTLMHKWNAEEDQVDRLVFKMDRWREALLQTIQKLAERGDNVDDLTAKGAELERQTQEFEVEAESLASQGWWHPYAGMAGGALVAMAVVL